jgi:hypothetical protein
MANHSLAMRRDETTGIGAALTLMTKKKEKPAKIIATI